MSKNAGASCFKSWHELHVRLMVNRLNKKGCHRDAILNPPSPRKVTYVIHDYGNGCGLGAAPASPSNQGCREGFIIWPKPVFVENDEPPFPGTPLGNAASKANLPRDAIRALWSVWRSSLFVLLQ